MNFEERRDHLKELSGIKRRIAKLWSDIEDIDTKLEHCTGNTSGLPRSTAEKYVTESLLDKKDKLYQEIKENENKCSTAKGIIEDCEDVLIKTWMEYHYEKGFSWNQSARKSGSGISGNGARMSVERYLRRLK